jgi:uncharacterized protein (TIGR01777 family)
MSSYSVGRMRIGITGATGFVGRHVVERMRGHQVFAVSTRGDIRIDPCDAVIHLAGEPVAQRWTAEARKRIRASRVDGTRQLVDALRASSPRVLVSASAVGYYGSRGDEILTEASQAADDFLGRLAVEWEREALEAEQFGVRVVLLRIAMVLGSDGGALAKMLAPFRLGLGGCIGSGKQWMSWIHADDLAALVEFVLGTESVRGPVNASAPEPVTNAEFTRGLARALHRPAIFPVPKLALRLLFGEMAQIVYASQRVVPEKAVSAGFSFQYSKLGPALANLL